MTDFKLLGLSDRLVSRLAQDGLTVPTPIQDRAIPLILQGRDLLGLAQTGTGKTAAFGLPLVQTMLNTKAKPTPKTARSLILAPTRELAKQIQSNLETYIGKSHLKIGLVVGGQSLNAQANRLARGTDILVATPGRLIDHLDRGAIDLSETRFLVLDEADQMLDLGFIHALRKIASALPEMRQTLLFSATMPKQMTEIAQAYLTNPVRVQVAPPGKAADKVTQSIHFIAKAEKTGLLKELLMDHQQDLAVIFTRTKHGADRLCKSLVAGGFEATAIHGNKTQGQRDRALNAFREGKCTVLVATDVAARGIDIPDVRYVYNYDLPNVPENYVHRIGRTARAGAEGQAIAFCAPDEMEQLQAIEKVLKRAIPVSGGRPWQTASPTKDRPARSAPSRNRRSKPSRSRRKPRAAA